MLKIDSDSIDYVAKLEIGEFRIIGFYLYHVISNRHSDSSGTSGLSTALFNIDYLHIMANQRLLRP